MTAQCTTRKASILPAAGRVAPRPADPLAALVAAIGRGFATLALWETRIRQRETLARFDERMLADIGVGRAEAAHEAAKPFWRA